MKYLPQPYLLLTDSDESAVINVDCNTSALQKVADFMNLYKASPPEQLPPKPLTSKKLADMMPPAYAEYLSCDVKVLYDIIVVADSMDIAPLVAFACAALAVQAKDKTSDQIKATFIAD